MVNYAVAYNAHRVRLFHDILASIAFYKTQEEARYFLRNSIGEWIMIAYGGASWRPGESRQEREALNRAILEKEEK